MVTCSLASQKRKELNANCNKNEEFEQFHIFINDISSAKMNFLTSVAVFLVANMALINGKQRL